MSPHCGANIHHMALAVGGTFNSLRTSDVYTYIQVIIGSDNDIGAKPLPETMLIYYQPDSKNKLL